MVSCAIGIARDEGIVLDVKYVWPKILETTESGALAMCVRTELEVASDIELSGEEPTDFDSLVRKGLRISNVPIQEKR